MLPVNEQVLVDSAAFVAWFFRHDSHHERAVALFDQIEQQHLYPVTSNLIILETATVLSHRSGQPLARQFLTFIPQIPTIHVNEALHQESLDLFQQQTQRGTSVVDCSNVVLMQRSEIELIFSFDDVFTDTFHLRNLYYKSASSA